MQQIGLLWEKGEAQSRGGDLQDALLSFLRAKALLTIEQQAGYSST